MYKSYAIKQTKITKHSKLDMYKVVKLFDCKAKIYKGCIRNS